MPLIFLFSCLIFFSPLHCHFDMMRGNQSSLCPFKFHHHLSSFGMHSSSPPIHLLSLTPTPTHGIESGSVCTSTLFFPLITYFNYFHSDMQLTMTNNRLPTLFCQQHNKVEKESAIQGTHIVVFFSKFS